MQKTNTNTNTKNKDYSSEELKLLFEALRIAPKYLSKQFILLELVGLTQEQLDRNKELLFKEENLAKIGDKTWQQN